MTSKKMKLTSTFDDRFRRLLGAEYPVIVSIARKIARGDGAMDLAHDAVLKMWYGRKGYDLSTPFRLWATVVVRSVWRDKLRRAGFEKKLVGDTKYLADEAGLTRSTI